MNKLIKEWKNINGYEKLYKVSNYGDIKAKRRVIYGMIDCEIQPMYVSEEKILNPFDNGNGYLTISLFDENGQRKNHYIHRLVAQAFIPNPDNLPQVNHVDYDRKNNKVSNLEWCTAKENTIHSLCNKPKTHSICKSKFGYKYIGMRGERYRVNITIEKGNKRFDKCFKTLQEALDYRNLVIKETGIECKDNFNKI